MMFYLLLLAGWCAIASPYLFCFCVGSLIGWGDAEGLGMTYPLAPHGVFWTIQGEGVLLGEPMAFVRLAGCSVGCPQCDTNYRVDRRVSVEELVREVQAVVPKAVTWPWVWITGGEPTDHDLAPLVDALRTVGCRVALCTAGTRRVDLKVEWLAVSPHSVEGTVQRHGHELKVVPGLNGLPWEAMEEVARWSFPYRFVQPIGWGNVHGTFVGVMQSRAALDDCLAFVRTHPGWRLGIQAHKIWGVA